MATQTLTAPAATPAIPLVTREIKLDDIRPNPFNRKKFDELALDELARSIAADGLIQPIVVRSVVGVIGNELVAGERRWLAAKRARDKKYPGWKETITTVVKDVSAERARILLVLENEKREDLHPLERSRMYAELLKDKDPEGKQYTEKTIGALINRSDKTVSTVIGFQRLNPDIQQAFLDDKITAGHAAEICRLQPPQQSEVFFECFEAHRESDPEYKDVKAIGKDAGARATTSVKQLRAYIAAEIHLDLSKAPFDPKDELLLQGVSSCIKCEKRTGGNPSLFGDIESGDICTDPGCYGEKREALVRITIAETQRKAAQGSDNTERKKNAEKVQVQKISERHLRYDEKAAKDVLYPPSHQHEGYTLAAKACKLTQKAIYVDGAKAGQVVDICIESNCNHGRSSGRSSSEPVAPMTAAEKNAIQQRKVERAFRGRLMKAVLGKLPAVFSAPEIKLVADYVVRHMDYPRRKVVAAAFGLGDDLRATESEEILKKHVSKAKPGEMIQFMLLATLAGEVEMNSWSPPKPLAADHPLIQAAKLYKVNVEEANYPESELEEGQHEQLRTALCDSSGAEKRWMGLARTGASNEEIAAMIREEMGEGGSTTDSGPVCYRGSSLSVWFNTVSPGGRSPLSGAALIAETRALFRIGPRKGKTANTKKTPKKSKPAPKPAPAKKKGKKK